MRKSKEVALSNVKRSPNAKQMFLDILSRGECCAVEIAFSSEYFVTFLSFLWFDQLSLPQVRLISNISNVYLQDPSLKNVFEDYFKCRHSQLFDE